MPFYPKLNETPTTRRVTDTFRGYNHNLRVSDGEWFDMRNLTGEHYPLLANRDKRGTVQALNAPAGIEAKEALAWVDGNTLYYNGYATQLNSLSVPVIIEAVSEPANAETGEYWHNTQSGETRLKSGAGWQSVPYPTKQLVSMGAYLCVFPDKVYINTADLSDYGSMEARFEALGEALVEYELTRQDGELLGDVTKSDTAPSDPSNGQYWIDTSDTTKVLRQWSETNGDWIQIATVYTRISSAGIGVNFNKYDGVVLSGCELADNTAYAESVNALNGAQVIYDKGDDYITVVGFVEGTAQQYGGVVVERKVPDMDFVCEAGNRLWGCYYGLKDGEAVNELYCCVLGDFKNWQRYMGVSTDAWAASVGSDGAWTGAINYLGSPTFFKEERIHMVLISSTGAHQVDTRTARGVQKGSHRSLVVAGETLYYKSRQDVCAFQGGLPSSVSQALGDVRYYEATAGAFGDKYYISMRSQSGWNLFVLDTATGRWHREDELHVIDFASADDDLYAMTTSGIIALRGTVGEVEDHVEWEAVSGILYYETIDHKYVTRYNLRMRMEPGAELDIYLMYDSDGQWHHSGRVKFGGLNSAMIPVRPRRCDHVVMKLVGKGEVRLFSIARILEEGSDQ